MVHSTDEHVKKNAAIELAEVLGWAILPVWWADGDRCGCGKADCPSPAKHPIAKLAPNGLKNATADPATIERWWSACPQANLAARTGEKFWSLDLDGIAGIRAFSQVVDAHDELPEVPISRTGGGGRHIFFAPNDRIKNAAKLGGMPVDVRGCNGYVLLPPSDHVSGNPYLWELPATKYDLEPAPPWLVDYVTGTGGSNGSANGSTTKFTYEGDLATHSGEAEGGRNNTLCRLVGAYLAERGVTPDLMTLATAWGQRCRPALDETQVRRTVLALAEKHAKGTAMQPGQVVAVRYDTIAPEDVIWLWLYRIAIGKLTVISGNPGVGKSYLTLDIAARVSSGRAFPDGAPCEAGTVVIVSCEDGPGDTIRPRLDLLGADVSRVIHFEGVRENDKVQLLQLDRHIPALDEFLERNETISTVIVDPLAGFLGETDSHKNAEVRSVLGPLARLAEKHQVAVVGINHLTKREGKAIFRSLGSMGIIAAARAAWAVTFDPDDPDRRLFLPVKNNLAESTGLAYRITDGVVTWEEAPVLVAVDDLDEESDTPRDEAKAWLSQMLANGPVMARDIFKRAKVDGVAERTLRRAKKELRVKSEQYQEGWCWMPPQSAQAAPCDNQEGNYEF